MNIQSSILSIDESSLSILHQQKSHQTQKNEQLFKQCSEYRTQIRQLKQDNQWLHSVNQGLVNECNVLKDILNEKKELIMDCNTDLRIANEEINRLEDLLVEREEQMREMEGRESGRVAQLELEIIQARKNVSRIQKELEDKNRQIRQLVREKDLAKVEHESKQKVYIHQVQQKVLKILQKYQKSDETKTVHSPKQNSENILNQLVIKIEHLSTILENQRQQHTTQLKLKKTSLISKQKQVETLQYQLKQASDLIEQYQTEMIKSSNKLKQIQSKHENLTKTSTKNFDNLYQTYKGNIDKLVQLFILLISQEEDMIVRLGSLMKTNKNQYQIDIVIQQLKQVIAGYSNAHQNQTKLKKQLKDKQNRIVLLQQQYDSLKLKHMTLQREFQAIIDDNRRILKFNQLSRFRTQRNIRNNDHQYEKPNIQYTNTNTRGSMSNIKYGINSNGSNENGNGNGSGNKENVMNFNNVRLERKVE